MITYLKIYLYNCFVRFWNLLQVANKKNKDIRLNHAHIKTTVLLWMWYQNIKQSLGAKKNSGCCFKSAQYPINIWIIWLKITCRYWPLNLSPDKGMEAKQVNMKFYLFFFFFERCGGGVSWCRMESLNRLWYQFWCRIFNNSELN